MDVVLDCQLWDVTLVLNKGCVYIMKFMDASLVRLKRSGDAVIIYRCVSNRLSHLIIMMSLSLDGLDILIIAN